MTSRQHPQDIALGFAEAWNRQDADGLARLFVTDADFVNVVGLWWRDRESIRKAHAYGFTNIFGSSAMTLGKVSVRTLGEDVAVVHARWQLTGQDEIAGRGTGSAAGLRRGVISFTVLRQRDGTWLAVAAQNTDRVSGAETLLASGDELEPVRYDSQG